MSARLVVDGEVTRPRTLGFEELAALPGQVADVGTVAPGRTGGGVALTAILAAVGPKPGANEVTLESTDGSFVQSAPLDALVDAVVAYRVGDAPLPEDQGGPLRFYAPRGAGGGAVDRCTNVKGLGRIRLGRA
jgi:DMSO/TMAO reductase YedYZ molybdopterin-dependent catalytic subunit